MESIESILVQEIMNRASYCAELRLHIRHQQTHQQDDDMDLSVRMLTLRHRISAIDGWLAMLPPKEAFILREHLSFGRSWDSILHQFKRFFGYELDEYDLTRCEERALQMIAKQINAQFDSQSELLTAMDAGF